MRNQREKIFYQCENITLTCIIFMYHEVDAFVVFNMCYVSYSNNITFKHVAGIYHDTDKFTYKKLS